METKWNLINNDTASGNYNTTPIHYHQHEDVILDEHDFINYISEGDHSTASHSTSEQSSSSSGSSPSPPPSHKAPLFSPTDSGLPSAGRANNDNHNIHEPNHHTSPTRHRLQLSASLPIEVPTRRARRDTSSMKLSLMMTPAAAAAAAETEGVADLDDRLDDDHDGGRSSRASGLAKGAGNQNDRSLSSTNTTNSDVDDAEDEELSPVRKGDRNRPAFELLPAFDDDCDDDDDDDDDDANDLDDDTNDLDDDSFFDQEFNENHHNHYSVNDLHDENLSAEEDPMRLFASIQALAKSLHEDSELFGSLPPKRLLESPIRSIALV